MSEDVARRRIGSTARSRPGACAAQITVTVDDLIRELHRYEATARVVIYDPDLGIHRAPVVIRHPGKKPHTDGEIELL